VTLLAVDFPPWEFLVFAVAILIGLIQKIVEFAKKVRERSIEAEREGEKQFGAELEEAPEPRHAEPPPRLELFRRLPRPRREEEPLLRAAPPPPPPPPPTAAPSPPKRREHEIVRMLRTPRGARNAVLLAEVLGRPKALRRGR
jgi:hypothetical protein